MTIDNRSSAEVEVGPDDVQTMAVSKPAPAGVVRYADRDPFPLARMTDDQFAAMQGDMVLHHNRVKQVQRAMMVYGVHYGVPGQTEEQWAASKRQPAIYKAGIQLLGSLLRLVPVTNTVVTYGDPANTSSPAITAVSSTVVHRDTVDGPVVATAEGACSSWEEKYRWRNAKRTCPSCNKPMRFYKEARGGPNKGSAVYWCDDRPDSGGCGAEYLATDPVVAGQEVGKVPNEGAYDLLHTIVQMAAKRSTAQGVISAASASDLFTEGLEDFAPGTFDRDGTTTTTTTTKAPAPAGPKAAPASPAPAPTKPTTSSPPSGDKATDAQLSLVRSLARNRLNASPDWDDSLLEECLRVANIFRDGHTILGLTKRQASVLIEQLKKLPVQPGHAEPVATTTKAPEAAAAPPSDTDRSRKVQRAVLLDLAGRLATHVDDTKRYAPTIRVRESEEAPERLVLQCTASLGALGMSGPVAVEDLTTQQLVTACEVLQSILSK